MLGLDRHGEGGAEGGSVLRVGDHHGDLKLVEAVAFERGADEPLAELRHEVDRLGSNRLRGHDEVAFVLPVFVVDQDDDAAPAQVVQGLFYACQRHFGLAAVPAASLIIVMPVPDGVRPAYDRLAEAGVGEPLDVLGQDVDLDVHRIACGFGAQVGVLGGEGNQRDAEPVVAGPDDG